jgi:hypothetical protein
MTMKHAEAHTNQDQLKKAREVNWENCQKKKLNHFVEIVSAPFSGVLDFSNQ